jgi:membrane protein implicated in regulation of membrane protease activity
MIVSTLTLLITAVALALLAFVVPTWLGVLLFLTAAGLVVYAYFRFPRERRRPDDDR